MFFARPAFCPYPYMAGAPPTGVTLGGDTLPSALLQPAELPPFCSFQPTGGDGWEAGTHSLVAEVQCRQPRRLHSRRLRRPRRPLPLLRGGGLATAQPSTRLTATATQPPAALATTNFSSLAVARSPEVRSLVGSRNETARHDGLNAWRKKRGVRAKPQTHTCAREVLDCPLEHD